MTAFFTRFRRNGGVGRGSLRALMTLDAARLSDLGLTRFDIADALREGGNAADVLSARRAQRATDWLR
ncbi:DUF1127 domain-containing protein [Pelagibacterium montanilacus]|uniref:DUF1127 domain-containing protein n=1 Tax=Pelagibacterium montanilacus TaxID=2185280 RepID=UPI000F8D4514|nr:DUF1127 domain-containing protein [Pelagibacterium montanilacus]